MRMNIWDNEEWSEDGWDEANPPPFPIWNFWLGCGTVSLEQAVLLLLDWNPEWNKFNQQQAAHYQEDIEPRYRKLFPIAESYLPVAGWAHVQEGVLSKDCKVELRKFALWAVEQMQWSGLPDELLDAVNLSTGIDGTAISYKSKFANQEAEIMRILKLLNYDLQALPQNIPGFSGVKKEAKEVALKNKRLFQSPKVFDKAWQRLRDEKLIK